MGAVGDGVVVPDVEQVVVPAARQLVSAGAHFSPHTSWLCDVSVAVQCSRIRTSCIMMLLSRLPVARWYRSTPARPHAPSGRGVRTCLRRLASQICTSAPFVPTAMCLPSHPTARR